MRCVVHRNYEALNTGRLFGGGVGGGGCLVFLNALGMNHGIQISKVNNTIQYNITLLPSVNTIALECFVVPSTLITQIHPWHRAWY